LTGPLGNVLSNLDPSRLAEMPDVLDLLRKEAVPALRAATDTQRQVALLQASGADCVGYNEILFWESRTSEAWIYENDALDIATKFNPGYENSYPPVGASYCYWRAAWERLPFPEIDKGEDTHWKRMGARCYGLTGVGRVEPRLICEIHGGNTNSSIMRRYAEFRRAPQWDEYCKETMEAVNARTVNQ